MGTSNAHKSHQLGGCEMRVMVFIIAVMCFIPLCSAIGGSIYYYNQDERVNLFYIDSLITVTVDRAHVKSCVNCFFKQRFFRLDCSSFS